MNLFTTDVWYITKIVIFVFCKLCHSDLTLLTTKKHKYEFRR